MHFHLSFTLFSRYGSVVSCQFGCQTNIETTQTRWANGYTVARRWTDLHSHTSSFIVPSTILYFFWYGTPLIDDLEDELRNTYVNTRVLSHNNSNQHVLIFAFQPISWWKNAKKLPTLYFTKYLMRQDFLVTSFYWCIICIRLYHKKNFVELDPSQLFSYVT